MSTLDTRSTVLFDALGSFWTRLFGDRAHIQALQQGTEAQLGQAYLDTLEAVLVRSVDTVPVFHKEYFKLIVLREEAKIDPPPVGYAEAWTLDAPMANAGSLQSSVVNPDLVWEDNENHSDFYCWEISDGKYGIAFKNAISTALGVPKYTIEGTGYRLSLWAVNALVDRQYLYKAYGTLINQKETSSEVYRQLVKGVFQYYMMGPALKRIEAALNVIHNIPVAKTDGEKIKTIVGGVITTDVNRYEVPVAMLRSDLAVGQTLTAFEPLSEAFRVVDYITDPTWWHSITLPLAWVETEETTSRLTVSAELTELKYQEVTDFHYGDPRLYYGAHYNGIETGNPAQAGLHHNFAYTVMDTLLKYHTVAIFPHAEMSINATETAELIQSGMPSYTFVYVDGA